MYWQSVTLKDLLCNEIQNKLHLPHRKRLYNKPFVGCSLMSSCINPKPWTDWLEPADLHCSSQGHDSGMRLHHGWHWLHLHKFPIQRIRGHGSTTTTRNGKITLWLGSIVFLFCGYFGVWSRISLTGFTFRCMLETNVQNLQSDVS